MQLSGSDFYRAYRPSACDLRLYLHHKGVPAAEPGPYEQVIRHLGDAHGGARAARRLCVCRRQSRLPNDTTPRYDQAAAKLAWQRTLDWFNKYLR